LVSGSAAIEAVSLIALISYPPFSQLRDQ
jgi:hypothetical protein